MPLELDDLARARAHGTPRSDRRHNVATAVVGLDSLDAYAAVAWHGREWVALGSQARRVPLVDSPVNLAGCPIDRNLELPFAGTLRRKGRRKRQQGSKNDEGDG